MSNLHADIIANIEKSEDDGGIWMKDIAIGSLVNIQTCNTLYTLEHRSEDEWFIQGHQKYCAIPTKAYIAGSTWGGSMLKIKFIGVGMNLEFGTDDYRYILTSPIKEITNHFAVS